MKDRKTSPFFGERIEKGLVAKLEGIVGSEFAHMDYGEAIQVLERARKFEFPVEWASTCSRSTSGISPKSTRRSRLAW